MRRVNKKVIESLVKAGALDSMGGRAQLMAGLAHVMEAAVRQQKHRLAGQVSMFEAQPAPEERLPDVQEWSESQMLAMEKEALGFYITGHPLNKYAGLLKELSVTSTDSLDDLRDRQEVKLGGLIRESKRIQTKRTGDLMAYLTIEDLHGTAEVIVFPDTYRDSQEVFSMEQPVIVAGYTDKTDKGLKVIAQKIVPIEKSDEIRDIHVNIKFRRPAGGGFGSGGNNTVNAAPPRLKTLTLTMFSSTPPEKLPQLESIFERYSGDCPVYIKIVSPRKWETLLRTGRHVLPSSDLITELEGILGKKSAALN